MCLGLSRRKFGQLLGASLLVPSRAIGQDNEAIRTLHGQLDIAYFKAKKKAQLAANENQTIIVIGEDALLTDASFKGEITLDDEGLIETLKIVSGQALAAFKPRNDRQSELILPNATASIRGTGFYANVDHAQGSDYLCCCYGRMVFENATTGEAQELHNRYHTAVMINDVGDFTKPPYDAPYGHYDDELIMLEGVVGRKPHWQLPDDKLQFLAPYNLPKI